MRKRVREGILIRDENKRYCLHELGVPLERALTFTSGYSAEIWLNREWIAGCIEGDGQDYWFFVEGGRRFLLPEHMKARYTELH
ncbi:DUF5348 domain-containing protein [Dictyobacter arantiisoli]|uniref:DUF5348 domain-containing protein n=1 Tax=Dictyobacter arantiisoli TaxID=2014874 RepID=A0A5A5TKB4_9CHLR|nr:hypothetical protein KDI_54410 [Dictyobacter arantiisoli]